MNTTQIEKARASHHAALKSMLPAGDKRSGLAVWRKLRRIERDAHKAAEDYCNGVITEEFRDELERELLLAVRQVFYGDIPGLFINWDPRGYALKLEPGSVPANLETDWGRYQILAPEIN